MCVCVCVCVYAYGTLKHEPQNAICVHFAKVGRTLLFLKHDAKVKFFKNLKLFLCLIKISLKHSSKHKNQSHDNKLLLYKLNSL